MAHATIAIAFIRVSAFLVFALESSIPHPCLEVAPARDRKSKELFSIQGFVPFVFSLSNANSAKLFGGIWNDQASAAPV